MRGIRRWLIGVGTALLVGAAALFGAAWYASGQVLHQQIRPVSGPAFEAENYGFRLQNAQYQTSDGVTIDAWFLPGARRDTVIVVHGFWHDRAVMLPTINVLHQAGFTVVAPTLRGAAPDARRTMTTLGFYEQRDVLGAVEWARGRPEVDPDRIALLGISMGAASVILAGAADERVAAVVAESPFQDVPSLVGRTFEHFVGLPAFPFGPVTVVVAGARAGIPVEAINPRAAATRIAAPLFVIHGLEDNVIPYTQGVEVYRAAGPARELWLSTRAQHANAVVRDPVIYTERVVEFLNRALDGTRAVRAGQ